MHVGPREALPWARLVRIAALAGVCGSAGPLAAASGRLASDGDVPRGRLRLRGESTRGLMLTGDRSVLCGAQCGFGRLGCAES